MKPRIAVVDDEARMGQVLSMILRRGGWDAERFEDPVAFLEAFSITPHDLVLTDLKMPQMDGLEVLAKVKARAPDVPVILISAHGTVKSAVDAMRHGALDFIEKPFDNDAVIALVARGLELTRLSRENRYLRGQLQSRHSPDAIISGSPAMTAALELARRAARSKATVLITGESGTGKELVARAIHWHSERVGQPFVAVNCKALAAGVLESELFGHVKGAFTGAQAARPGVFARADGGTLLLDEIGEVDDAFQAKLLRVLQEGELVPVGADRAVSVDVRVVAATHRDLAADVAAGRFREDLYYRLAVIPIRLPPLRERPEDIPQLAHHFLAKWSQALGRPMRGWTDEVEAYLSRHTWPGNVRELEHAIERGCVLAASDVIELAELALAPQAATQPRAQTLDAALDEAARRHIQATIASCGGKKGEAAERLGVDRTTLYRLMKRHGIDA
jgi:DNA-binding NtrC family response regulator